MGLLRRLLPQIEDPDPLPPLEHMSEDDRPDYTDAAQEIATAQAKLWLADRTTREQLDRLASLKVVEFQIPPRRPPDAGHR